MHFLDPLTSRTVKNVECKLADSMRIKRSEDSTDLWLRDLGKITWNEMYGNKILATAAVLKQKELRAEVAEDLLHTTNSDSDFLKKVVTGDES